MSNQEKERTKGREWEREQCENSSDWLWRRQLLFFFAFWVNKVRIKMTNSSGLWLWSRMRWRAARTKNTGKKVTKAKRKNCAQAGRTSIRKQTIETSRSKEGAEQKRDLVSYLQKGVTMRTTSHTQFGWERARIRIGQFEKSRPGANRQEQPKTAKSLKKI